MAPHQIRPIRVEGNLAYVPLTRGYEAVIDAADVPLVDGFNWAARVEVHRDGTVRSVYAARKSKSKHITMHRQLLGSADGVSVRDHRDGDGLNNRRSNLRPYVANAPARKGGAEMTPQPQGSASSSAKCILGGGIGDGSRVEGRIGD